MLRNLSTKMKNKAIFLDRDGTIICERHYLSDLFDIKLLPGAKNALKLFKSAGFLLIVVTNQSGIARGFFDRQFVKSAHRLINRKLEGAIDDFYVCPHSPEARCNCRKPKTGMLRAAADKWKIDLSSSWVIGDKKSDIMLGRDNLMKTMLIGKGSSCRFLFNWKSVAEIILKNDRNIMRRV